MRSFMGYSRENGVGVRNHLLVIASVSCAGDAASRIADELDGAVAITHQHGCGHLLDDDIVQTRRTLVGNACNPNVAACLVVGLGCELIDAGDIADEITSISGKPADVIGIQREGGSINAITRGIEIGRALIEQIRDMPGREEHPLSSLTVGIAGNSDEFGDSELPGRLTNFLLEFGVSVIQGETSELIGADSLAIGACANPSAMAELRRAFLRVHEKIKYMGMKPDDLRPLISYETSLQKLSRAGNGKFIEVTRYGEASRSKGLIHMESTRFTPETISGMSAAGAQIILTAAPLGNARVGSAVSPTIPLRSIQSEGDFLRYLTLTANGRLTEPEMEKLNTFAITRIGPST
jgi:altronate dehydratase large subunit